MMKGKASLKGNSFFGFYENALNKDMFKKLGHAAVGNER